MTEKLLYVVADGIATVLFDDNGNTSDRCVYNAGHYRRMTRLEHIKKRAKYLQQCQSTVEKCAEQFDQIFMAGVGDFALHLSTGLKFDTASKLVGVYDVQYGGQNGFNQLKAGLCEKTLRHKTFGSAAAESKD